LLSPKPPNTAMLTEKTPGRIKCEAALRLLEDEMANASDRGADMREMIGRLDRLEQQANRLRMPVAYASMLYSGVERGRAARGQGPLGARGVFVPAGVRYARRCRRVRNGPLPHTVGLATGSRPKLWSLARALQVTCASVSLRSSKARPLKSLPSQNIMSKMQ